MLSTNKVTTILQLYKRPHALDAQIAAVRNQTVSSDLVILINGNEFEWKIPLGIPYIHSSENLKYHFRFTIALLYGTEYIAFLDDDTIPGKIWYENCIDTIARHDCLCTGNGRLYKPNDILGRRRFRGYNKPENKDEVEVDFGGHAWFIRRKNLNYMWQENIIEYETGEDIMLSANLKRFGNIPTYIPPQSPDNTDMWSNVPNSIVAGNDEVAGCKNLSGHGAKRCNLCDTYIKKGWKILNG